MTSLFAEATMARTTRLLPRFVLLALALSAVVVARSASPAHACSCLGIERTLANPQGFEAAFVGTVVEAPEPFTSGSSAQLVDWKFRVDKVYRGELPATIVVKSAISGASCGFEGMQVGSQVGVLLRREGNDWQSGLCSSGPPQLFTVLGESRPPGEAVTPTTPTVGTDDDDDDGLPTGGVIAIWGGVVAAAIAGAAWFTHRRTAH
jgi:hypothetical protein